MLIFVHLLDDFSGSPRVLRDLITSLEELELCPTLIAGGDEGFLSSLSIRSSVHLYKKSASKVLQAILYFLAQFDLFFRVQLAVRENTKKGQGSLVVVNTVFPIGAVLGAYFSTAKTLLIMHETTFRPNILKNAYRFIIAHCVDDIVYVSDYLKSVEYFNGPTLHVLPNGLRSDFNCDPKINTRVKFDGRTILFVGSLKEYKGIKQFFELAKRLPDFNFLAALNCDPKQASEYFSQNRLEANSAYVVRPSDLQALYSSSMMLVNLSLPEQWIETFGLTILEGMHFGCPVVVPKVGGHCDFVSSSHGLFEDSVNIGVIANFIKELSSDFNRYQAYSDACVMTAKQYSYIKTSEANNVFFQSMIKLVR